MKQKLGKMDIVKTIGQICTVAGVVIGFVTSKKDTEDAVKKYLDSKQN